MKKQLKLKLGTGSSNKQTKIVQTVKQFQNNAPQCKIVKTFNMLSSTAHNAINKKDLTLQRHHRIALKDANNGLQPAARNKLFACCGSMLTVVYLCGLAQTLDKLFHLI